MTAMSNVEVFKHWELLPNCFRACVDLGQHIDKQSSPSSVTSRASPTLWTNAAASKLQRTPGPTSSQGTSTCFALSGEESFWETWALSDESWN
eukprot:9378986-Pyramimonas_sp.AAC.1